MSRSKARKFADLVKFMTVDYDNNRATIQGYARTEDVEDAKAQARQEAIDELAKDVSVVNTGRTLETNDVVFISTATQTITLPASPSEGDEVSVIVGDFKDTTLARNGSRIMGLEEDLIIDSANIGLELVYTDATNGWRIL